MRDWISRPLVYSLPCSPSCKDQDANESRPAGDAPDWAERNVPPARTQSPAPIEESCVCAEYTHYSKRVSNGRWLGNTGCWYTTTMIALKRSPFGAIPAFHRVTGDLTSGSQGQRHGEDASMIRRALHRDTPTVMLDNVIADVEAQPQPYTGASLHGNTGYAVETLKNKGQIVGWNARPLVHHAEERLALVQSRRENHRFILWRVLERVGEQIGEHLPNAIHVHLQLDRRFGHLQQDRPFRRRALLLRDLAADLHQVGPLRTQRQLARFDARDVEQVIYQQLHAPDRALHACQMRRLRRAGALEPPACNLCQPFQTGKRRLELMRSDAQELVLLLLQLVERSDIPGHHNRAGDLAVPVADRRGAILNRDHLVGFGPLADEARIDHRYAT